MEKESRLRLVESNFSPSEEEAIRSYTDYVKANVPGIEDMDGDYREASTTFVASELSTAPLIMNKIGLALVRSDGTDSYYMHTHVNETTILWISIDLDTQDDSIKELSISVGDSDDEIDLPVSEKVDLISKVFESTKELIESNDFQVSKHASNTDVLPAKLKDI